MTQDALRAALERLRDGVVAMKNAIPLQSLGPEWRPFLGRTGEVNQALDLADAALSASDSGDVDGLRGTVPDALVVALAERHLPDGSPCFCEDWIAGSVSPFSTMNSEHADYCERVRAALTRPVSEVPEAAPSSETRRVLERLDRGVTRATRHTDGMVAARTMHLLIAELLREGASDD